MGGCGHGWPISNRHGIRYARGSPMSAALSEHTKTNGVDKVARYKWSMRDTPGILMSIHKTKLHVDTTYQRNTNIDKARAIASSWSWIGFGVLIVAVRDQVYWIIDGQHRHAAAMLRSDIGDLPCIVFETQGSSSEAAGFIVANTLRKPVDVPSRHKAKIAAGDPTAVSIQAVLDDLGVELGSGGKGSKKRLNCLAACYTVAEDGIPILRTVLSIAKDVCCNDDLPIHEKILLGLWYIHRYSDSGVDEPRMQKRIRQIGGKKLLAAAMSASAYFATGGAKVWASGILKEMNRGIQHKFTVSTIEN